jgi:hypothetical protein
VESTSVPPVMQQSFTALDRFASQAPQPSDHPARSGRAADTDAASARSCLAKSGLSGREP